MRPFLPLCALAVSLGAASSAAPTAVEAIAMGPHEVRVYWNPVPDAAAYVVYRDSVEIGRGAAGDHRYTDTSASPSTTYRYEVGAVDASGAVSKGRPYVERTFAIVPADSAPDVLVVGATTGGVAAAVTAARYGLKVALIEETRRLGGMTVNGLGATDLRRLAHSSGFFEEFRRRVVDLYGGGDGLKYEPRVAHQAMKAIVWSAPAGLTVYRQVRPVGVRMRGRMVEAVEVEEVPGGRRAVFHPRLVIDATECGDVAAWGGAPFRVGREPRTAREPHAGHLFYDRAGDRPLPGSTGAGDRRVQAYAYLMTVKDYGPGADRTIPRPPGYDPRNYEHAVPWTKSWAISSGTLPNGKFEVNQHPQGSDLQVVNYPYPTASYSERHRIEQAFRNHALGYLYYIQTVEGHRSIGLSDDDYRDSDDWPALLYIREARRFEGDRVIDETDVAGAREAIRADAIGVADYPMDSHAVQPKTDWQTPDMGEGEFYLPQWTPWSQVPYDVMVPRRLDNVFVPTAVSATHVAYGTLRLEPVRMHFGQAAGVAAYLCLAFGETPRSLPARQVQAELLKQRMGTGERPGSGGVGGPGPGATPAYLYLFADVRPGTDRFDAIEWLAARGFFPCPPPEKRTPSAVLVSQPFRPDDPIARAEAERMLALVKARGAWGERHATLAPPSHGAAPVHRQGLWTDSGVGDWPEPMAAPWQPASGPPAVFALAPTPGSAAGALPADTLTRGQAARLLADFMGWPAPSGTSRYADLESQPDVRRAADALAEHWIDSRLWDSEGAFAPGGRLVFRAGSPVTRAQFAQLVYLAHLYYGPLWYDHPADRAPMPVRWK